MLKKMIPYLLACAVSFYLISLLGREGLFVLVLLMVNPAVCFVSSVIYGINNRFVPFQLLFPIFVGVLFIPAIFIFYNHSAWFYAVNYTAVALFGNTAGYIIAKASRRKK